jgi:hypothetical protein
MDRVWGIRVDEHAEIEGLDLAEHGTFGYPEFGIADPPVDGGPAREQHPPLRPDAQPAPA